MASGKYAGKVVVEEMKKRGIRKFTFNNVYNEPINRDGEWKVEHTMNIEAGDKLFHAFNYIMPGVYPYKSEIRIMEVKQ
jgi:hypothetical protein